MAHDDNCAATEPADATDDRLILAEIAVSSERGKVLDQRSDVIQRVRSVRMARHLRLLPGCQLRVRVDQGLLGLLLEFLDLI